MKNNKLLKLLIICVVLKQLVWVAFVPLWHFPDEQAHFGQVAHTFDSNLRKPNSNLTKEILTSERILQTERDWGGNNKYTYHPEYNISYTTDNYQGRHEEEIKNFPIAFRKIMTILESTFYPPLYYLPLAVIYKIFFTSDLLTRLFLCRVFNIIISLLIVLITYKLYRLVFGNKLVTVTTTIFLVFQPMFSFVQAGINSDNLYNLIFLAGIYIALYLAKKGIKIREVLIMIGLYICAIYTKPQGYLLIPIFLFPLVYRLIINKSLRLIASSLLLLGIVALPFFLRLSKGRQFISDVYPETLLLPNLTFLQHLKWTINHTFREVLPWYWGVFRWLSLTLPRIVNRLINRSLAVLLIGLIIYIIRIIKKKNFSFRTISLTFFLYVLTIYFAGITVWDYLFTITHGYSFGIQGRYFFPVIGAITGLLTFGIIGYSAKEKIQRILLLIVSFFMVILHEAALFRVLTSYFSTESLAKFFIQASQYKPWFFKSPFLQFIIVIHFISLGLLLVNLLRDSLDYEKN